MDEFVPGAILAVRVPQQGIWAGAAGLANLSTGTAMTPDTLFRIGSVTKTFTAAAITLAAQDGDLALDQTLEQWLPGYFANESDITLLHLLTHTSGIYNYTDNDAFMENIVDPIDTLDIISFAASQPANFAPGEDIVYCNTGYVILAVVLERATGKTWEEFIQTRLLDSVGLDDTYFGWLSLPSEEARSYYYQDGQWIDSSNHHPSWGRGAGNMVSSVHDLMRWSQALYGGEVFEPAYQEVFMHPWAPYTNEDAYALGTFIHETPLGVLYGHTGTIFGSVTYMFSIPELQSQVVAFINRNDADRYVFADIAWEEVFGHGNP